MDRLDRAKKILGELIAFPTVSSDSNLEMIAHVAGLLEDAGARVETFADPGGTKANLLATLGPDRPGGILLAGHTDVVPVADQDWTRDPFILTEEDGRLFGRGSCDMKGFVAATLAMADAFAAGAASRPLHFAFTYDEETGCFGARQLAEILATRLVLPAIAIVGEPTGMRIVDGHKGCHEYSTHFTGLPGHGSQPDNGVNAVEYAARYVQRLIQLKQELRERAPEDSRFEPPWTTVNVGAFTGGVAHNVIAPSARVDWEMRPVQPSDERFVKAALRSLCEGELLPAMRSLHPDATIELEVIGEVAGLIPAEPNEARRIVAELTGANGAELVAFGTEAGIYQDLGMDVVVCGPGSIEQAHKADEFLAVDQLAQCLDMLGRLAARLGA